MRKLINATKKFFTRKEEGASMAEYALLLFLITAALVAVIGLFADQISTVFEGVISALTTQP